MTEHRMIGLGAASNNNPNLGNIIIIIVNLIYIQVLVTFNYQAIE